MNKSLITNLMNAVHLIGELHALGVDVDGRKQFIMKTTEIRTNDVTETVEKIVNFQTCVATGRFLNALDTAKCGELLGIEGKLINFEDGSMGVEVNDLIIL